MIREWSYYGAAHRYDIHGSESATQACERLMRSLREEGREAELRARTDDGDRCAAITWFEILVDQERLNELRDLGRQGDDRAFVTLMEHLVRRGREAELRREAAAEPYARFWLAELLEETGRVEEALAELALLASHPKYRHGAHSVSLGLLVDRDRIDDLRRLADDGDRPAKRRLHDWLAEHGHLDELQIRAHGDDHALWRLAETLAERGRAEEALALLRPRAETGHPHARTLIARFTTSGGSPTPPPSGAP